MLALDYVSPLPPVRSGIADYSLDLLPHLCRRADVRVMRLPGQPVDAALAERWRPIDAVRTGEGGRLPLYQMGNNPYHEAVWDLALERPGVLVLHDVLLHHLLMHRTLGQRVWEPYEEEMEFAHGWIGRYAGRMRAMSLEDDASLFSLPAHRRLLGRQRGLLVHSRWAAETIRDDQRLAEGPELRVKTIPMGIPLPAPASREQGLALRRRFGVPAEAPVLGSFGFQTPIKRTSSVIAALADARLARVHLLVVGEASPGLDLTEEARRAGVADRVHVTGFVPFEDFEASVAACNLCLNLRYPTAGETSASLLRVLALGRAAVVSDFAQFDELPSEVAVRVPLGDDEPAALAVAVAALLASPESLRRMGEAAREHVRREHDPVGAAAAVVAACEELAHHEPPEDRPAMPAPPTSLTWRTLTGSLHLEGAAGPWPAGERRRLRMRLANSGPARWLAAERGAGGVALETVVHAGADARRLPWIGLSRDLLPGEETAIEMSLRRPLGPVRLECALKVLSAEDACTPRLELEI